MAALLNLHPVPASTSRPCDECPRLAAFYDAANDHYLCKRHTERELEQLLQLVRGFQRG